MLIPLLLAFAASDSARLVERRVIVEPLGISVEMPAHWFPTVKTGSGNCLEGKTPTVFVPLSTDRAELAAPARAGWHREYATTADSVLAVSAAVAHFGTIDWQSEPCWGDLQARVYVVDLPIATVVQRVQDAGIAAVSPAFAARSEVADTAGWRRARILWHAWYSDFGSITHMDFYIRRVRGRTVVLLLMYTPYSQGDLVRDPLRVLDSFRENGEVKRGSVRKAPTAPD
jgi:hypothetical protein